MVSHCNVLEFYRQPENAVFCAAVDLENPSRRPREIALRRQLGSRFFPLSEALGELARLTVRASSVIENLNSRLRGHFFLRRHLGPDYLALLQFFLNHRRFLRGEQWERVGKEPYGIVDRRDASPLTGDARLRPVLPQLTGPLPRVPLCNPSRVTVEVRSCYPKTAQTEPGPRNT